MSTIRSSRLARSIRAASRTRVASPSPVSVQLTCASVPPLSFALPLIEPVGALSITRVVAVRRVPNGPCIRTLPPRAAPPAVRSSVKTSMNRSASNQWFSRSDRNWKTACGEAATTASASIVTRPAGSQSADGS
jgi:hypothetical protein